MGAHTPSSVKELVASQDLDAYNAEGEPSTEAFLEALDAARSKKQRIGAAWRWAVAIADGGAQLGASAAIPPSRGSSYYSRTPAEDGQRGGHDSSKVPSPGIPVQR
jgi:hypothetical protein